RDPVAVVHHLQDPHDVGVVQLGEQRGLPADAGQVDRAAARPQALQGHDPAHWARLVGLPHRPGRACADLALELVLADADHPVFLPRIVARARPRKRAGTAYVSGVESGATRQGDTMTTSSAEPARLMAYAVNLAPADGELVSLAIDLNTAMTAFKNGAGGYVPASFDADWAGHWVRNLYDESLYLGQWVDSVGDGFILAGADPDGDGIFAAEDQALAPLIAEPTRAEAQQEADGRAAAARVRLALQAAGYDPDHFDPATIRNLANNDPQFRA